MSQTPPSPDLGRFTVRNERARTTLRLLSQTGMMAVTWVVGWTLLAPVLSVRVLNPIELFNALSTMAVPAIVSAVVSGASTSSSLSIVELMLGSAIWMLPIFVGVLGIATITSALWYVVGRFADSSAATDAGGES
jgi:hypothetical protein